MPRKREPRPREPERTRREILDAAFEEFCAEGLAGARVDRIADRAGCNKRMLYHYFGNKEALFQALLEDKARQSDALRDAEPASLADALVHWQEQQAGDADWTRLLMFEALTYGDDPIANEATRRAGWRRQVDGIRAAQDAGLLAADLDPAQLQLSLVALVTFPIAFPQYTRLITGRSPDDPRFLAARKRFLRAFAAYLESEDDAG